MYPGAHAPHFPDKPAVVMLGSGRTLTYGELERRSAALARAFHDLGLRPGSVVALLSDNQPEAFEVYWAAIRSGLYVTAVNHHLTAEEAAYIVADCDAEVVVASAGVGALAAEVARLTDVAHRVAFGGTVDGHDSYEVLLDGAGDALEEMPRGADMLYSSGTTGRPKGIKSALLPITVHEPDMVVGLIGTKFGMGPDTVYLSAAPIYHAAPLRWCGSVHAFGGTVVMAERFDAESVLSAIAEHRVTIAQFVPTMFVRLLQLPEQVRARYDHSSLRVVVHAAAPCPPDVKQAMIDWWGPKLVEYYSSTEANGFTVISSPEWLERRGSVGRSILGTPHVCDDDGRELPPGEVGTLWFERDRVPFSYHKDEAKTAAATHPDHPLWTAIGDVGYVDEDGYVYLTDRKGFMIISGGVNVYPQETENALALHPAIYDVAVIGTPHPDLGEQVTAFVQLREGHEPSEGLAADIVAAARERVAHYKAPREVRFVDSLPRTPTGKLVKRRLVAQVAAGALDTVATAGA